MTDEVNDLREALEAIKEFLDADEHHLAWKTADDALRVPAAERPRGSLEAVALAQMLADFGGCRTHDGHKPPSILAAENALRRDSDGSGEADKTGTGLAEGDSAGRNGIAQNTSSNPPTTRGKV